MTYELHASYILFERSTVFLILHDLSALCLRSFDLSPGYSHRRGQRGACTKASKGTSVHGRWCVSGAMSIFVPKDPINQPTLSELTETDLCCSCFIRSAWRFDALQQSSSLRALEKGKRQRGRTCDRPWVTNRDHSFCSLLMLTNWVYVFCYPFWPVAKLWCLMVFACSSQILLPSSTKRDYLQNTSPESPSICQALERSHQLILFEATSHCQHVEGHSTNSCSPV